MLTSDAILELVQSFYLGRKASGFPGSWLAAASFGSYPAQDEACRRALQECRALLALDSPGPAAGRTLGECAQSLLNEWQGSPRNICFRSSGSQGVPKKCVHSSEDLNEEASFLAGLCGDVQEVASAVPPHHCYGFMFSLWLPLARHLPVKRTLPFPSSFFSCLGDTSLGIGFPLLYERSASAHGAATLVCASSPLESATFARMKAGGYGFIEIFGSSETGVLGYRKGPGLPFTLAPYYRKAGEGLIRIRSGLAATLTDRLEWRDERHFLPLGRRDHLVQVGGRNVSPDSVAHFILKCPGVLACQVRKMRPEEGERLKAFIVAGANFRAEGLKDWIRRLPAEERPQSISYGPRLPTNSMGKSSDW